MKYLRVYITVLSLLLINLIGTQTIAYTHYIKRVRAALSPKQYIKSKERVVTNNRYASTQASVRFGNDLHPDERAFLEKRIHKVRSAIEKICGVSIENQTTPRIAVVCSGGGCRATLGTIGALSGLQEIGVLDAVTYISALSGSTWAVGLWMSTGMTIAQLKKYIVQKLVNNMYRMRGKDVSLIGHALAVKVAFNQPCTSVDLFGSFLANNLLRYYGDDCQTVHLSDQIENIKNGDVPFPIYTAVDGRVRMIGKAPWYEFTPFEIGSADYATYVPSWAYARHFNNGVSTDYAPEQSLGFHFGVFGSAFALHAGHAWKRSETKITNMTIKSLLDKAFKNKIIANARVFWAKVPNFMYGIKGNELHDNKILKLVDAGLECNLPYLPVSGERAERKSDIIICFDFSKSNIPNALKKAEEYARQRGLKFPKVDYTDVEKRTMSIFRDENDKSVPTVIYMPRISDKQLWQEKKSESGYKKYHRINNFDFEKCAQNEHCKTTNFQYTRYQSQQVMDQMEFNVVVNKEKILEAIRKIAERE